MSTCSAICEGVIDLDAEIPQRRNVCPEQSRVQSYAADPLGEEAGILAGCHAAVRTAMASEQELADPFSGDLQIAVGEGSYWHEADIEIALSGCIEWP
jgi:hypothetical protein